MTGRVTSFTGQCAASNWRATRCIVDLPGYGLVHLLDLPGESLEVIEMHVSDGAPAVGRKVSEIDLPEGSIVISVLRGGSGFVPKADTVIEAGDEVLVCLDPGLEDQVTPHFAIA